ncbi:MAG: tail fiber protein [Bacteroidota bacterium]
MSQQYLSELRVFSFNFPPKGWAPCNGQLLPISQNQALFSLLGVAYGGDGVSTFGLPNLQGSVPMHVGNGMVQGQKGGENAHTLLLNEMPMHSHAAIGSSLAPNVGTPANSFWPSGSGFKPYAAQGTGMMSGQAVGMTGNNQPHDNMAPYLTLNICIAVTGIFPSRN